MAAPQRIWTPQEHAEILERLSYDQTIRRISIAMQIPWTTCREYIQRHNLLGIKDPPPMGENQESPPVWQDYRRDSLPPGHPHTWQLISRDPYPGP